MSQRQSLPDARWHFQHGPIDLLIWADGDANAVADAHEAAWQRFGTVLPELVADLPWLRRPLSSVDMAPQSALKNHSELLNRVLPREGGKAYVTVPGAIATRMHAACWPHRDRYITPMAAVAGAVAEEIIAHYNRPGIQRAWVNNGGDIAWHLAEGASLRLGVFADLARWRDAVPAFNVPTAGLSVDGTWQLDSQHPARGAATSGWRGRSFSLGIADSATVLATTASIADAAATVIANAVNTDDPRIQRRPASELKDDSDLGDLPVTVNVPELDAATVQAALQRGLSEARRLQTAGLIEFCALSCQGQWLVTPDLTSTVASALTPTSTPRSERSTPCPP